ncbi:ribosomal protein s17 [Ophiocordyceps sinensis CO18]|uniref:Ribosomal protein s17 n=1 Tax=Ophiocordyceps sinensis (strain Co18 / CGMCC 3.14243) TaxID=911162 RepID=T5AD23_OPHSC|nr:ribosomal protein s17 [Ophiocordyceps sinensis CO18]
MRRNIVSLVFSIGPVVSADPRCLEKSIIQAASQQDGNSPAGAFAISDTDANNFINFCARPNTNLTKGQQAPEGSCNPIPMGMIPTAERMVSAIITSPQNGQRIPAGQNITIAARVTNLDTGKFTNPKTTYYTAPQKLNDQGIIIGHLHFTCQDIGPDLNPQQAPNANKMVVFKDVLTQADATGLASAEIGDNELPPGNYRCCTIVSAANHQPVLMPLGLRGGQDDCVRFSRVK